MRVGIVSAMREEVEGLVAEMGPAQQVYHAGMRTYHEGLLWGRPVALVFSRWGKVATATTATHLITHFDIGQLIFTGVAGAADPGLRVGDMVIGSRLWQHDMDARPLFARHEVPLLGVAALETDPRLRKAVVAATGQFLTQDLHSSLAPELLAEFHIAPPGSSRARSPAATALSPGGQAAAAFPKFIQHVASVYSHGVLRNFLCNHADR
jgi:adenosylhomocysteine nucleosidase